MPMDPAPQSTPASLRLELEEEWRRAFGLPQGCTLATVLCETTSASTPLMFGPVCFLNP